MWRALTRTKWWVAYPFPESGSPANPPARNFFGCEWILDLPYLAFAAAFFLRSAQLFFIRSESLFRPAALSLLACFALTALLLGALLVCCGACLLKLFPLRMLRAEVSLAISLSISSTILAVSN